MNGPATQTITFQGSLSGETVTGNLNVALRVDNGANGVTTGSGATAVTLTKH